jgi:hypothetical protein
MLNLSSKQVFSDKTLTRLCYRSAFHAFASYISSVVYKIDKPILELGVQDRHVMQICHGHVDPRSDHIRTVRSGSMEPDAIMFCCG